MRRSARSLMGIVLLFVACGLTASFVSSQLRAGDDSSRLAARVVDRSPVDVVLASDGTWLAVANETSDSVSLIETRTGTVVDEVACGQRPASIVRCLDGQHVLVSCSYSGEVVLFEVRDNRLTRKAAIQLGFEPVGIAVTPDGERAYVGLAASAEVAEIDLVAAKVSRRLASGLATWQSRQMERGSPLAVVARARSSSSIAKPASRRMK